MLTHMILIGFLSVITLSTQIQAAEHKTLCPTTLSSDIVIDFAEVSADKPDDPHNVLVKENIKIRSALPTDGYKREKIIKEQKEKNGEWRFVEDEPLRGKGSALCVYKNDQLDKEINTIKVTVYPKE